MRRLAARLTAKPQRTELTDDQPGAGDVSRRLAVLEGVSVFFMQPKAVVRKLARESQQISVKKGDVLVRQGAANTKLFVVMRGQFAASVEASGDDSLPISMLGPLDVFGVASVVSGNPAAATVTATSDGEVIVIEGKRLIARDDPDSAMSQLQRVATQRLALLEGARSRTRVPTGQGTVVAIYSPKGGAGKTTLAVNLSASLGAGRAGDVALLDLGLPYNDAALISGEVPTTCLARLVGTDGAFDELLLSTALYHPAQFSIVPVVLKPEEADLITPDVVSRTLDSLRNEFKYVVVDCCVQLSETVLAVLERAQHVVVITTPRLPSLKDVPHLLDLLQDVLHIPTGRVHLTVNHTASRTAIGREEIERLVGRRTSVDVGFDAKAERAAIRGELLAKVRPDGPVATATAQLAARISGRPASHQRVSLGSVASRLDTLRRRGFA